MIDEIFEQLCSKITAEGWINLEELNDIMKRQGLGKEEIEEVMRFLEKYFLEVDARTHRAKVNLWACDLFTFSVP